MNKKGFTLIELLAVIVILAIIALIAVPIVLGIIEDSRKSATLRSAEHYLSGVEQAVARAMLNGKKVPDGEYQIMSSGDICLKENISGTECKDKEDKDATIKVEIDGSKPETGGIITLKDGSISYATLKLNSKDIELKDGKLDYVGNSVGGQDDNKEQAGLYDAEGNLLASWDELVNDYGLDIESDYTQENFQTATTTMNAVITNNENLNSGTKLVIKDGISKIGDFAFTTCNTLKSFIIPEGIESIGFGAFVGTSIESITLPSTLKTIHQFAFQASTNLKSIILPPDLTSIENNAFEGCTSLESITLPENLTTIGSNVFSSTGLKSIVIPNSVTSIGNSIFSHCTNLTSITYNGTASGYPWGAPNITVE